MPLCRLLRSFGGPNWAVALLESLLIRAYYRRMAPVLFAIQAWVRPSRRWRSHPARSRISRIPRACRMTRTQPGPEGGRPADLEDFKSNAFPTRAPAGAELRVSLS